MLKDGVISKKSKFVFHAKFWFQQIQTKAKKSVASLLNCTTEAKTNHSDLQILVQKMTSCLADNFKAVRKGFSSAVQETGRNFCKLLFSRTPLLKCFIFLFYVIRGFHRILHRGKASARAIRAFLRLSIIQYYTLFVIPRRVA